jgi:hypothetical protein
MLTAINHFSPVRVLDRAEGGTLQPGEIGVVMARAGVGKSTCVTQMGVADLLRGHKVVHVALNQPVARVREAYDEALRNLVEAWPDARLDADALIRYERRRHILSYLNSGFDPAHLRQALEVVVRNQDFKPDTILVDGFDFSGPDAGALASISDLGRGLDARVWMTALSEETDGAPYPGEVPPPCSAVSDQLSVVLHIEPATEFCHLRVLKARNERRGSQHYVRVDPRTMLVQRD